ncbi:MAG: RHS repeat domain-containing protein, partial [Ignavibacteriota bacterium]
ILQIDNFGLKTLVYNSFIYDSSAHYVNAFYKANTILSSQEGDTTYFYLINQQTSKRVFTSSQSSPLYFDSLKYLRTNSDTGYMGQIILQRVYDVSNLSYFKDVNYAYYVRDTVGRFLYPVSDTKPSNEGKLKTVTDPRGNPVKYYYHPVYSTEYQTDNLPGRPVIDFYVLYSKDTVVKESQNWEDIRMPVITQSFVNDSNSLFLYNKYDPAGNINYAFNDNKYLNELSYDALERISQVNFPYDFGKPDTTIYVDTVFENVNVDLKADLVSTYDFLNNNTRFYVKYNSSCSTLTSYGSIYESFHLAIIDPGGDPSENTQPPMKELPLIRFNNPDLFRNISSISYAYLKLSPKNFNRNTGGDTSLSKVKLRINPLKQMFESGNSIIFSESNLGYYYFANAFMEPVSDCSTTYENDFDVTDMLNYHIFSNNDSVVAFKIDAKPVYSTEKPPSQSYFMDLYPNINYCNFVSWCSTSSPVLHVVGVKRTINRDTVLTYQNYSSKFTYNDNEKSVLTNLKYDNQSVGKRKSLFDGFYRVKQNRLYTSADDFDSTAVNYNYLSLKLNSKDGRSNLTKYSYNQYLNPSKTQNPDASYTLVSETYLNGYTTTFGTVPGMVVKKVLTDETGKNFDKYFDALGNLRREIKYVEGTPDYNGEGGGLSNTPDKERFPSLRRGGRPLWRTDGVGELIPLYTDYKYDDLYRVIEVKTPNNKHIYYTYDGLGRQSSRTTPDAGEVKYKYDKNDNLRFSQDNNQANKPTETPPSKFISYRGYDGLNRLLYLCDAYGETYLVPWS